MTRRVCLVLGLLLTLTFSADAQTATVALPEGHEFTEPEHMPFAVSPDGTRLAYMARAMLFVTDLKGGQPVAVRGPVEARGKANPIFTPDGQAIVYWASDDSVLERVPVGGGTPVRLGAVAEPIGMSWARDGGLLIGQGSRGIVRMPARGGAVGPVVQVAAGETAIMPHLLPDGDHLLFTLGQGTPRTWSIVVQSIRTGQRTTLGAGSSATYVPGDRVAWVQGTQLLVDRLDPAALKLAGQPRMVASSVVVTPATGAAQYAVAANGIVVSAPAVNAPVRMALVDLQGKRTVLGEVPTDAQAPRVTLDGKRVAFAAATGGSRSRDIYVADVADVAHARKVIADGTFPVFSPDGQWLAFGSLGTARENGEEVLFMQRVDGSGEARVIAKPARAPENWRPGDQGFTFITHRGGANNYDLWAYNPDRKEVEPLVTIDETAQLSGAFSLDRRWFAYMSNESGDWQIWVQPYPKTGAKFQVTKTGGRSPLWLPDGRLVFEQGGAIATLTMTPGATPTFSAPETHPIGGFIQPLLRRAWDVMPDGRLLMLFREGPKLDVSSALTTDTRR